MASLPQDFFPRRRSAAFTLIELLTVITIIAVLAGISLPIIDRVKSSSDNVQCSSNLRQIGVAVALYQGDHNNNFPGPIYYGQAPWYSQYDTTTLGYNLESYLNLRPKQVWNQRANVLVCRAYERAVTLSDAPVYVTCNIPTDSGDVRPWGDPGATPALPTLQSSSLSNFTKNGKPVALSQVVAIRDVDQAEYANSGSKPGWLSKIPKTPVHGEHQNALFFDLHVGRVDPVTHLPN